MVGVNCLKRLTNVVYFIVMQVIYVCIINKAYGVSYEVGRGTCGSMHY